MPGKKLIVEKVWQQEHGGGTEYLSLVYEHSWGAGLAKNQLQFLADEINNGRIVLPPPARDDRPISEITREMADIMERVNKYEYAERTWDGIVDSIHEESFQKASHAKFFGDSTIVRRSVGEWEEVSNG